MTRRAWFPFVFVPLVFIPLPLIWTFVFLAPFGSPFSVSIPLASLAPTLIASTLAAIFAAHALRSADAKSLGRGMAGFLALSLAAAIAGGIFLHPDFYSAVFMAIVQTLCILLFRGEVFYGTRAFSAIRSGFYRFGLAACVLFTLWLCLMGYALVTRAEQRWTESLFYNIYNAILAIVLYFTTVRTLANAKRTASATRLAFLVDGLDFGPVIGPVACELAGILFATCARTSCAEIRRQLQGEPCDCDFLDRPGYCADYSAMYNATLKLRRLSEALRIGTVETMDDPRSNNRMSWRFVPAEGVEVLGLEEGKE